ncbi:MAG: type II secretion system minor pseudopilin GspI [Pseudomonadota bacterium]
MRSPQTGFTLIEVMIALIIASLGLAAIGVALHQHSDTSRKLRDSTLAMFIASNEIAELRVNGRFPDVGRSTRDVEYSQREWLVVTVIQETGIEGLRRVNVSVAEAAAPERQLRVVTGFLSQLPAPPVSAVPNFESLGTRTGETS